MAAAAALHLGLTLFSFFFISLSTTAYSDYLTNDDTNATVYELLPKFGLPSGLLPDSVQSYSLSSDGQFVVVLAKPCYIQFDYLVYYDRQITGKLCYGSILHLQGIQVQRFFLWFDVDEIKVDLPPSDSIYFQVGLINKKLDVGQFKTVRSCRDGVSSTNCASKPLLENPEHSRNTHKYILELRTPVDEIEMLITE